MPDGPSLLDRAARMRIPLGFAAAAAVFYLARPTPLSLGAGLPVAGLGLLFRTAAAGVIRKDAVLAREGPYRLTRNPLYLGSFLLAAGFAIMSGSPVAAAILLLPFALVYPRVIRREEAELARRFGADFDRFVGSVPRFFPRRLNASLLESFTPDQYVSNREYNSALGFAGATLVLVVKYLLETTP